MNINKIDMINKTFIPFLDRNSRKLLCIESYN